ncbi:MAG: PEP/pyruvate-binding domain-containing protein, partial [Candidatus Omnitrophica bacterium]|nr:PEP/pyruvate-binding domain-containing protein [Candidatus Omnitrophota bacterium]
MIITYEDGTSVEQDVPLDRELLDRVTLMDLGAHDDADFSVVLDTIRWKHPPVLTSGEIRNPDAEEVRASAEWLLGRLARPDIERKEYNKLLELLNVWDHDWPEAFGSLRACDQAIERIHGESGLFWGVLAGLPYDKNFGSDSERIIGAVDDHLTAAETNPNAAATLEAIWEIIRTYIPDRDGNPQSLLHAARNEEPAPAKEILYVLENHSPAKAQAIQALKGRLLTLCTSFELAEPEVAPATAAPSEVSFAEQLAKAQEAVGPKGRVTTRKAVLGEEWMDIDISSVNYLEEDFTSKLRGLTRVKNLTFGNRTAFLIPAALELPGLEVLDLAFDPTESYYRAILDVLFRHKNENLVVFLPHTSYQNSSPVRASQIRALGPNFFSADDRKITGMTVLQAEPSLLIRYEYDPETKAALPKDRELMDEEILRKLGKVTERFSKANFILASKAIRWETEDRLDVLHVFSGKSYATFKALVPNEEEVRASTQWLLSEFRDPRKSIRERQNLIQLAEHWICYWRDPFVSLSLIMGRVDVQTAAMGKSKNKAAYQTLLYQLIANIPYEKEREFHERTREIINNEVLFLAFKGSQKKVAKQKAIAALQNLLSIGVRDEKGKPQSICFVAAKQGRGGVTYLLNRWEQETAKPQDIDFDQITYLTNRHKGQLLYIFREQKTVPAVIASEARQSPVPRETTTVASRPISRFTSRQLDFLLLESALFLAAIAPEVSQEAYRQLQDAVISGPILGAMVEILREAEKLNLKPDQKRLGDWLKLGMTNIQAMKQAFEDWLDKHHPRPGLTRAQLSEIKVTRGMMDDYVGANPEVRKQAEVEEKLAYYYHRLGAADLRVMIQQFGFEAVASSIDASVRQTVHFKHPPSETKSHLGISMNVTADEATAILKKLGNDVLLEQKHYHLTSVPHPEQGWATPEQIAKVEQYERWDDINYEATQLLNRSKKTMADYRKLKELIEQFVLLYLHMYREGPEEPQLMSYSKRPHENPSDDWRFGGYEAVFALRTLQWMDKQLAESFGVSDLSSVPDERLLKAGFTQKMNRFNPDVPRQLIEQGAEQWQLSWDRPEFLTTSFGELINVIHQRGIEKSKVVFGEDEDESNKAKMHIVSYAGEEVRGAKQQPKYLDLRQPADRSLASVPMAARMLAEAFGPAENTNTFRRDDLSSANIFASEHKARMWFPLGAHSARIKFNIAPHGRGGRGEIEYTDSGATYAGSKHRAKIIAKALKLLGFRVESGEYTVKAILDKDHGASSFREIKEAMRAALGIVANVRDLDLWLHVISLHYEDDAQKMDQVIEAWANHYARMGTLRGKLSVHSTYGDRFYHGILDRKELDALKKETRRGESEREAMDIASRFLLSKLREGFFWNGEGAYEDDFTHWMGFMEADVRGAIEQETRFSNILGAVPPDGIGQVFFDKRMAEEDRAIRSGKLLVDKSGEVSVNPEYANKVQSPAVYFIRYLSEHCHPGQDTSAGIMADVRDPGTRVHADSVVATLDSGLSAPADQPRLAPVNDKKGEDWGEIQRIGSAANQLQNLVSERRSLGKIGAYQIEQLVFAFNHDDFSLIVLTDEASGRIELGFGLFGTEVVEDIPYLDRLRHRVLPSRQIHNVEELRQIFRLNGYKIGAGQERWISPAAIFEKLKAPVERREEVSPIKLSGVKIAPGFASGKIVMLKPENGQTPEDFAGGILVADETSERHKPFLEACSGVVNPQGGEGTHSATAIGELGKPGLITNSAEIQGDKFVFPVHKIERGKDVQTMDLQGVMIQYCEDRFSEEEIFEAQDGDIVTLDAYRGVLYWIASKEDETARQILDWVEALKKDSKSIDPVIRLFDSIQAPAHLKFLLQENLFSLELSEDQKARIIRRALRHTSLSKTAQEFLRTAAGDLASETRKFLDEALLKITQMTDLRQVLYLIQEAGRQIRRYEWLSEFLRTRDINIARIDFSVSFQSLLVEAGVLKEAETEKLKAQLAQLETSEPARCEGYPLGIGLLKFRQWVLKARFLSRGTDHLEDTEEDFRGIDGEYFTKFPQTFEAYRARKSARLAQVKTESADPEKVLMSVSSLDYFSRPLAGGKASNAAEYANVVLKLGHPKIKAPNGFVVTVQAFQKQLDPPVLFHAIRQLTLAMMDRIKVLAETDVNTDGAVKAKILRKMERYHRAMKSDAEDPGGLTQKDFDKNVEVLKENLHDIANETSSENLSEALACELRAFPGIAYRSSGLDEDSEREAGAGRFSTVQNIMGARAGMRAIQAVWDSRAQAVLVQPMVAAVKAGVAFSAVGGDFDTIRINSVRGLGIGAVSGRVDPDRIFLNKANLDVEKEIIGRKETQFVLKTAELDESSEDAIEEVPVPEAERNVLSLNQEEIRLIGIAVGAMEEYYGHPVDMEWAFDPYGNLFILQVRPITTLNQGIMRGKEIFFRRVNEQDKEFNFRKRLARLVRQVSRHHNLIRRHKEEKKPLPAHFYEIPGEETPIETNPQAYETFCESERALLEQVRQLFEDAVHYQWAALTPQTPVLRNDILLKSGNKKFVVTSYDPHTQFVRAVNLFQPFIALDFSMDAIPEGIQILVVKNGNGAVASSLGRQTLQFLTGAPNLDLREYAELVSVQGGCHSGEGRNL